MKKEIKLHTPRTDEIIAYIKSIKEDMNRKLDKTINVLKGKEEEIIKLEEQTKVKNFRPIDYELYDKFTKAHKINKNLGRTVYIELDEELIERALNLI